MFISAVVLTSWVLSASGAHYHSHVHRKQWEVARNDEINGGAWRNKVNFIFIFSAKADKTGFIYAILFCVLLILFNAIQFNTLKDNIMHCNQNTRYSRSNLSTYLNINLQ